jgi:excisionase family DNA binding protein
MAEDRRPAPRCGQSGSISFNRVSIAPTRARDALRDGPIMDSNFSNTAGIAGIDRSCEPKLDHHRKSSTSPILLDVEEALAQLKVSRGLLYRFMRTGQIKFVKLGNRTLFRPADITNFVNGRVIQIEPALRKAPL